MNKEGKTQSEGIRRKEREESRRTNQKKKVERVKCRKSDGRRTELNRSSEI